MDKRKLIFYLCLVATSSAFLYLVAMRTDTTGKQSITLEKFSEWQKKKDGPEIIQLRRYIRERIPKTRTLDNHRLDDVIEVAITFYQGKKSPTIADVTWKISTRYGGLVPPTPPPTPQVTKPKTKKPILKELKEKLNKIQSKIENIIPLKSAAKITRQFSAEKEKIASLKYIEQYNKELEALKKEREQIISKAKKIGPDTEKEIIKMIETFDREMKELWGPRMH